ncbi:hypothetical protein M885DRAFT_524759 [Pelagophyceae sp. CCMP2097]|nr:hypothetical protein M885DRAFT_524759 [Pelagophyceae sp. CCMP2097]
MHPAQKTRHLFYCTKRPRRRVQALVDDAVGAAADDLALAVPRVAGRHGTRRAAGRFCASRVECPNLERENAEAFRGVQKAGERVLRPTTRLPSHKDKSGDAGMRTEQRPPLKAARIDRPDQNFVVVVRHGPGRPTARGGGRPGPSTISHQGRA